MRRRAPLNVTWIQTRDLLNGLPAEHLTHDKRGGEGTRTLGLRLAKPPLFQLSYTPDVRVRPVGPPARRATIVGRVDEHADAAMAPVSPAPAPAVSCASAIRATP